MSLLFTHITPQNISTLYSSLRQLADKIWFENYQPMLTLDQINYMLDLMYSEDKVNLQLQEKHKWYLIEIDGQSAGYIAYHPQGDSLFVDKFYLDKIYHSQGIAREMMQKIEEEARSNNYEHLILAVNKRNSRAIKFYEKYGFEIKEAKITDIGKGYMMDDYIMQYTLK